MSLPVEEFLDLVFEDLVGISPLDEVQEKFLETIRGEDIAFHITGELIGNKDCLELVLLLYQMQWNKTIGNLTLIVTI